MDRYLHSTLIKYKDNRKLGGRCQNDFIYIPLWLNIKFTDIVSNEKLSLFTFHSD